MHSEVYNEKTLYKTLLATEGIQGIHMGDCSQSENLFGGNSMKMLRKISKSHIMAHSTLSWGGRMIFFFFMCKNCGGGKGCSLCSQLLHAKKV
jgi:hypothetical protein